MSPLTFNPDTLTVLTDDLVPDTGMNVLAVSIGRDLDDDEANQLAALTGYAWRARMSGTRMDHTHHPIRPDLVVFRKRYWDVGRSDPVRAWRGFADLLRTYIADGTPIRTTDRAGAGTKGTRLIDGFGQKDADALTVHADAVVAVDAAAFLQAMTGTPTRL